MKKKEERCEVPIAAMIDVVFLLLVYFIVTSTQVIDEAYVQVNLPGKSNLEKTSETLDVYVFDSGYELMGRRYDYQEIEKYFTGLAQVLDDPSVNIKVSQKAEHHKLVRLLDLLNKVKVNKFSLHTLK